MKIAFHMGAHGTDGDMMLKSLLNNRGWLLNNNIEVVTPNRFRGILDEALMALNGGVSTPDMEEIMLDSMLEGDATDRVIFSSPSFMGPAFKAISNDGLYPHIGTRMVALANLFPSAEIEFFIGLRNPALLLRVLLAQATNDTYESLMGAHEPTDLRWSSCVRNILRTLQGRHRVVLWSHEDTPLIWPELLRLIGAIPPDVGLKSGLVYLSDIVGKEGIEALSREMRARAQLSVSARRGLQRQIIAEFGRADRVEESVVLPGWTQETVDTVTRTYYADLSEIAGLPGVEFIRA